jgi:hypothetical protein
MPCCGTAATGRDMTPRDHAIHQASIIIVLIVMETLLSFNQPATRIRRRIIAARAVVTKKLYAASSPLASESSRQARQAATSKRLERCTTV